MTRASRLNAVTPQRKSRRAMLARRAAFASLVPLLALLHGATRAADTLTQAMPVSKAELATPEGRRAVQERAGLIAARLCRAFRDTRTVAHRETYAECTRDALATATAQIDKAIASTPVASDAQAALPSTREPAQSMAGN